MTEELKPIHKQLKKELDKNRYQHTMGVMYTAGNAVWDKSASGHAGGDSPRLRKMHPGKRADSSL